MARYDFDMLCSVPLAQYFESGRAFDLAGPVVNIQYLSGLTAVAIVIFNI